MAAEHRGTVKSGRLPIPGTTVTATQADRKEVTTTDENGAYVFQNLAPGAWTIEVEMFGFQTARRETPVAGSLASVEWDLKLKPAEGPAPQAASKRAPFERVDVNQTPQAEINAQLESTSLPELQTENLQQNANESFLVTGSLSRGLQVSPREEMFWSRPGEQPEQGGFGPGAQGMGGPGPAGMGGGTGPVMGGPGMGPAGPGVPRGVGGGPGMSGGRPGGFDGPGRSGGGRGPSARGDRRPGGRPEWQGRPGVSTVGNRRNRGQDTVRGSLFFSLRNSALDARPYSLTGQTADKPSYAQSRFGLVAGGPLHIPKVVRSDRTFFFVNYFGTRSRNPFDATATVPAALERAGDFSQSIAGGPAAIFDPLSRLPFPDNRIHPSRLDPAALGLLNFIPLPNQAARVQNYRLVASVPQNSHNLGARVMQTFSRRDRLSFSFNLQSRNAQTMQLFGFRDTTEGRGLSTELGWTHNFSQTVINNLRGSFSRNRADVAPFFAYKQDVAAQLNIRGTSADPVNYGPPNLSFTNFGGLNDASGSRRRDQTAGVNESVIWVRGTQTLTFGGGYRRSQINSISDQNGRGSFTFTGLATSAFDDRGQPLAGTGFDLADFLLGLPQSSSIRFGGSDTYFRGSAYNFFLQDDWRVRTNFSVNVGLRYEFLSPLVEKYDRMANLDIAPAFTAVAVVTPGGVGPYSGEFPGGLVNPDRNNFAPRMGIAWRPSSNSPIRIRAGYGVYYNGSVYNQAAGRLAQQPPFAKSASFVSSLARTLTLRDGFSGTSTSQITNTYAVDRFYRAGYAQTWNVSVQRDLGRSLVLELGYLGTKGTRLDIQRLPNRATPGSPLTAEQRRQIGNAVGFTFDSSEGNSIYHAGQARLTRRFQKGISANLAYTWAKSIDNASTFGGGGAVVAQNDKDLAAERGVSSFDQRQALSVSYVLASPVGDSAALIQAHGWSGRLLKDWTLSGGVTVRSGSPFTATVLGNRADSGGTGLVGSGRADATGLPVAEGDGFFNLAAFTLPPSGRFGNAGRNTIPGPGSLVANMSFGRAFRFKENRRGMDIRIESNNVFNQVNFTRIGATVNASNYGLATSTAPMRTVTATVRFRY